jgi:hypothetical protein
MKSSVMFLGLTVIFVLGSVSLAQEAEPMQMKVQAEAKLGRDVIDRELTEEASTFSVGDRAYLWLRVTGAEGSAVTVTWTHGEHSYDVQLSIGGSPWRTWSYKTLTHAGDWAVTVTDSEGNVLKQMSFTAQEAGTEMR